jgi:hypothetical protein
MNKPIRPKKPTKANLVAPQAFQDQGYLVLMDYSKSPAEPCLELDNIKNIDWGDLTPAHQISLPDLQKAMAKKGLKPDYAIIEAAPAMERIDMFGSM